MGLVSRPSVDESLPLYIYINETDCTISAFSASTDATLADYLREAEFLKHLEPRDAMCVTRRGNDECNIYFLDENGERMLMRWTDIKLALTVEATEIRFGRTPLLSPYEELEVSIVRQVPSTLEDACLRFLLKHRQPNGFEWAHTGLPKRLVDKLNRYDAASAVEYFDPKMAARLHVFNGKDVIDKTSLNPYLRWKRRVVTSVVERRSALLLYATFPVGWAHLLARLFAHTAGVFARFFSN